ncbi:MAG: AAA family ATPase [Candidatus Micrarchaeota archaeon]|nr:AAA family ATPase [Candidatus Micrarchaeota archaeon]
MVYPEIVDVEKRVSTGTQLADKKFEEERGVIDRYIPPKGIAVLSGYAGGCKSLLSLYISACTSLGRDFLGRFPVTKNKVLYIDEENGEPELQRRLNLICNGMGMRLADMSDFYYLSMENVKLDRYEWKEGIGEFLSKHQPCTVIVDTFRRVFRGDENNAGLVSSFFTDQIRPLSKKYNANWLFIHHHKKGQYDKKNLLESMEAVRGSSDIVYESDCVMFLKRVGKGLDNLSLLHLKLRRGMPNPPLGIKLSWGEGMLQMNLSEIVESEEKIKNTKVYQCYEEAIEILKKINEDTVDTSSDKLFFRLLSDKNFKDNTIYDALQKLQEDGYLSSISRGIYKINKRETIPASVH